MPWGFNLTFFPENLYDNTIYEDICVYPWYFSWVMSLLKWYGLNKGSLEF